MSTGRVVLGVLIFGLGWLIGWYTHSYWPGDIASGAKRGSMLENQGMRPVPLTPPLQQRTEDKSSTGEAVRDLLRDRNYQDAMQLYGTLQSSGNVNAAARLRSEILRHADDLKIAGRYHDATRLLMHYLRSEYRDPEALELLSTIYYSQKDYLNTITTLYDARALAYRTENIQRIKTRVRSIVAEYAALLDARHDTQALLELYQKIIQLEPDYSPYFINLARAQLALEKYAGARQSLSLVVYDPLVSAQAEQLLASLDARADPAHGPASVIPLTPAGDQFLVDAWINDTVRISLLIDTGASLTIISPSTLDNAGVRYTDTDRTGWFNTANGAVKAPILLLEALSLGDRKIPRVEVGGIELSVMPGVDGLLGMNYLKHFQFFIDQNENVLRLSPNPG